MPNLISNLNESVLGAGKGKGCNTMIKFGAPEREYQIFIGGVGVASPSMHFSALPASLEELNGREILLMEWISNRMFGFDEEVGEINVALKTRFQGNNSSNALIMPENQGTLLPARIVNFLFLDIELPSAGVKLENHDALVLTSNSISLTGDVISNDRRFISDLNGAPKYEKNLIEGAKPSRFLAFGIHRQINELQLFSTQDVHTPVAVLKDSQVMVLPHYGIEVELVHSKVEGQVWEATLDIANLTNRSLEMRWFCDVLNRVKLKGNRRGRFMLNGNKSKTIRVRGNTLAPVGELNSLDAVMFSVCNLCAGPDEFASGYIALQFAE